MQRKTKNRHEICIVCSVDYSGIFDQFVIVRQCVPCALSCTVCDRLFYNRLDRQESALLYAKHLIYNLTHVTRRVKAKF